MQHDEPNAHATLLDELRGDPSMPRDRDRNRDRDRDRDRDRQA